MLDLRDLLKKRLSESIPNLLPTRGAIRLTAKNIRKIVFKQYKIEPFPVPIFVLGTMRGGTTYFTYLVSSHPNILKLTQPTEVFNNLAMIPIDSFENGCPYLGDDISYINIHDLLYNLSTQINEEKKWRSLLKRGFERYQKGYGGIIKNNKNFYIMIKNCHILNKVTLLKKIFPKAKFLLLIRDIYSHVYSIERHFIKQLIDIGVEYLPPEDSHNHDCFTKKKVDNNKGKLPDILINHYESLPKTYINLNYLALQDLERTCKGDYLVVNLRHFSKYTQRELDRMYDFLGLKRMLHSTKNKLFNNYTQDPFSEWQSKMDKNKIEIVDRCIEENKNKYNYVLQAMKYFE